MALAVALAAASAVLLWPEPIHPPATPPVQPAEPTPVRPSPPPRPRNPRPTQQNQDQVPDRPDPAVPAPAPQRPRASRGPRGLLRLDPTSAVHRILGDPTTVPPEKFRGTALQWRFQEGLTDEERIELIEAFAELTHVEPLQLMHDCSRRDASTLEALMKVAEHVRPIVWEATLYSSVLARLAERHRPKVNQHRIPMVAPGPALTRTRKALEIAMATPLPMLEQKHHLIPDSDWAGIRRPVELAVNSRVVGNEPLAIPGQLTDLVNRTLENFVEEDAAFAAGTNLFWLATDTADRRTVELMIDATRVFRAHRSRLPRGSPTTRSCLAAAATVVLRHGDVEQITRYLELVLSGAVTWVDDYARDALNSLWRRLSDVEGVPDGVRSRVREFLGVKGRTNRSRERRR